MRKNKWKKKFFSYAEHARVNADYNGFYDISRFLDAKFPRKDFRDIDSDDDW